MTSLAESATSMAECTDWAEKLPEDSIDDRPAEACLPLGFYSEHYIEQGMGRRISREEARGILNTAEEAGLVHQIPDTQDLGAIGNCCPDSYWRT